VSGLRRAKLAAERTRPLTARQAATFSAMQPGAWMTADQLYAVTGQTGMTENAAKHANALHRRGMVEKRKMGEPQWMRPKGDAA